MILSSALLTSMLCFQIISPSIIDPDRELYPISLPQENNQSKDTFSLSMPSSIDLLNPEIEEKNKQFRISAGLTTVVAGLTIYYACTTSPNDWISGTMGSYCTNTVLTAAATCFLYRDRNLLINKSKTQEK